MEEDRENVETGGDTEPCVGMTSRARRLALNSKRLRSNVLHQITLAMSLPGTASLEDTRQMSDSKLEEQVHEARNVQVLLTEDVESMTTTVIELQDAEGLFLKTKLTAQGETDSQDGEDRESSTERSESSEEGRLAFRLLETEADNEQEVSQLTNSRIKELWRSNCAQFSDYDNKLADQESEIESLKIQLEGLLHGHVRTEDRALTYTLPSTVVHREPCSIGMHETSNRARRFWHGKALPVEPFSGENEVVCIDDRLPTLQRGATWNGWAEEDLLPQLAGHHHGKALQEWDLISETDKKTFSLAIAALKVCLDHGNKAGTQSNEMTSIVSDFIRRLERSFRIAYGSDGIGLEARDTLLHGQLQEGLTYEVVRSPAVSGATSYTSLCMAAKNEERRLIELKKHQQYSQKSLPSKTPLKLQDKRRMSEGTSNQSKPSGEKTVMKCFICFQPGHFADKCPQKKGESRGKVPSKNDSRPNTRQIHSKDIHSYYVCRDSQETSMSLPHPGDMLWSDLEEDSVLRVELTDKGSEPKGVEVTVQGVPAVGIVDSAADIIFRRLLWSHDSEKGI